MWHSRRLATGDQHNFEAKRNIQGCQGDGSGKFGDCCSGNCDGFALGKNAEEYNWPDDETPVTEWLAGSFQEVKWFVGANHAGGYSYRLCKTPQEGPAQLTEECFQERPLEFVGDEQWVVYAKDLHEGKRTEIIANRTSIGTFPLGSTWTANPLRPHMEEGGSDDLGHGQIIDFVKVGVGHHISFIKSTSVQIKEKLLIGAR